MWQILGNRLLAMLKCAARRWHAEPVLNIAHGRPENHENVFASREFMMADSLLSVGCTVSQKQCCLVCCHVKRFLQ
jgi:hypothetical protein